MTLTSAQRRHLRALAHPLEPVVQLGRQGLTEAVLRQIDEALERHELIKVKLGRECPTEIDAAAPEIERETGSAIAQIIGHVIVVYRRRKDKPKILLSPSKRSPIRSDEPAPKRRSSKQRPPKRRPRRTRA